MRCPRCNNEDKRKFGKINNRYYCRACISFKRIFIDEKIITKENNYSYLNVNYSLKFDLSMKQKEISYQLINNYKNKRNTIVYAVCGAGKTEITYNIIKYVLNKGLRVCFTIPRKALCKELYERICNDFNNVKIGLIYGGVNLNSDAPFIICTTHQLYRFIDNPFEIIIIDEADAYPFYQNKVLNEIFLKCYRRMYIKMSATLTNDDIKDEDVLVMNRRYHNVDMPIPIIRKIPKCLWMMYLMRCIKNMRLNNEKVIVYVPLKEDVDIYKKKLSKYFNVSGVSSLSLNINDEINKLKNNSIDLLISTTILERGITIENVQVIVINASHNIFNERVLMQICGRVGRKIGYENGKIIFLDNCLSKDMKKCIKLIKKLNNYV